MEGRKKNLFKVHEYKTTKFIWNAQEFSCRNCVFSFALHLKSVIYWKISLGYEFFSVFVFVCKAERI